MWNMSDPHSSALNSFVHIKNLAENKADKNHTHTASTLKASDGTNLIVTSLSSSSDNNHVPSALLIKNMNDTLTSLSNASTSYVTKLGVSGKGLPICGFTPTKT